VPAYSRPRDGRPVVGEAAPRGSVPPAGGGGGNVIVYPPYYPWGIWGPGYGFGLGYLYYDPFGYGGYGYGWGDPYDYGGYGYGGGGGGGGYSVSQSSRDTGGLRLKIDPKHAQVYVDGYFVGDIDSMDGPFQKLTLDSGNHSVELKLEGYEPLKFDVVVAPGDTVIYKGNMKKVQ
jgi:PEGA domain-containing protein